MSISRLEYQDIDILSDSLSLLGEDVDSLNDDGTVRYGDIVLNIAAKASLTLSLIFTSWLLIGCISWSLGKLLM